MLESSSSDKEDIRLSSSERTELLSLVGEYVESASVSSAGESSSMILKISYKWFIFQKKEAGNFLIKTLDSDVSHVTGAKALTKPRACSTFIHIFLMEHCYGPKSLTAISCLLHQISN